MPLVDLYDDNFPHGTEAGYSRGCRGNDGCLYMADPDYMTCREVHALRETQPSIGRFDKVRYDGASNARRQDQVSPPAAPAAPKPRPPLPTDPMPDVNVNDTPTKDDHDAAAHTVILPAPVAPASGIDTTAPATRAKRPYQHRVPLDDPTFPHGTVKGVSWGCADEDSCPGNDEYSSCRAARRAYQNTRAADKRALGAGAVVLDVGQRPQAAAANDISQAIDDLTQARNELAKAKELLTEISGAHAAVVLERDNVADELALVRRANASLAVSIHTLEEEKAEWMAADTDTPAAEEPASSSFDVTAPPGVHVTVSIHVGSN